MCRCVWITWFRAVTVLYIFVEMVLNELCYHLLLLQQERVVFAVAFCLSQNQLLDIS